jgi:hypothetical protein
MSNPASALVLVLMLVLEFVMMVWEFVKLTLAFVKLALVFVKLALGLVMLVLGFVTLTLVFVRLMVFVLTWVLGSETPVGPGSSSDRYQNHLAGKMACSSIPRAAWSLLSPSIRRLVRPLVVPSLEHRIRFAGFGRGCSLAGRSR